MTFANACEGVAQYLQSVSARRWLAVAVIVVSATACESGGPTATGGNLTDDYPCPVEVGEEWAWEAAFITVRIAPPLPPAAEAAVRASLERWWQVGSGPGYGGGHIHHRFPPSFENSPDGTTLRVVVDFGSADESAFDQLIQAINTEATRHGASIRSVLLNVEDAELFNPNE